MAVNVFSLMSQGNTRVFQGLKRNAKIVLDPLEWISHSFLKSHISWSKRMSYITICLCLITKLNRLLPLFDPKVEVLADSNLLKHFKGPKLNFLH